LGIGSVELQALQPGALEGRDADTDAWRNPVARGLRGVALQAIGVVAKPGNHLKPLPGDLVLDVGAADIALAGGGVERVAAGRADGGHVVADPVAAIGQLMRQRARFKARGVPDVYAGRANVEVRDRTGWQHDRQAGHRIEAAADRDEAGLHETDLVVGDVDVQVEPASLLIGQVVPGHEGVLLHVDVIDRAAAGNFVPVILAANPAELEFARVARTDGGLEHAAQHVECGAVDAIAVAVLVVAVVAIDEVAYHCEICAEAIGGSGTGGPASDGSEYPT